MKVTRLTAVQMPVVGSILPVGPVSIRDPNIAESWLHPNRGIDRFLRQRMKQVHPHDRQGPVVPTELQFQRHHRYVGR